MSGSLEEQKVIQYDKLFHKMAYNFSQRMYAYDQGRTSHEDLCQALRLAFITLLRQNKINEKYTLIGNEYLLREAMLRCMLENSPIPITRRAFFHSAAGMPSIPPVAYLDNKDSNCNHIGAEDKHISEYPFCQWVDSLPPTERTVANAIMDGCNIKQIISMGAAKSHRDYHRTCRRIGKSYLTKYCGVAA